MLSELFFFSIKKCWFNWNWHFPWEHTNLTWEKFLRSHIELAVKTREEGSLCAVLSDPGGYGNPIAGGWQRFRSLLQWILAFTKRSNSTQAWQQHVLAVMKTNHVLGCVSLTGQGSEQPALAQLSFGQGWWPSSWDDSATTGIIMGLLVAVVGSWVAELDEAENKDVNYGGPSDLSMDWLSKSNYICPCHGLTQISNTTTTAAHPPSPHHTPPHRRENQKGKEKIGLK